jgi:hypothetical protein
MKKMGRWWWTLVSSRVLPFSTYGEEKDYSVEDMWIRVSFTRSGWLEQMWERKQEIWHE